MYIRLASDPTMRPVRVFTGDLLMNPFGFQVAGCPDFPDIRDKWERRLQRTLDELCAPGSATPPEQRMRWCAGGSWCKVPGSSMCAPYTTDPGWCEPTSLTPPIPDCVEPPPLPPPPPPLVPRVEVTPNPVVFPDTLVGTATTAMVVVRNAGGGTLTLGTARIVVTDPMSIGTFDPAVTSTCGPATPLSGPASCTLTARFAPMFGQGPRQGQLEIAYNAGMDRVERVPISGAAVSGTLEPPGCTTDPSTSGGPRRLCFGAGTDRSFTLHAVSGPVVVTLGLPPGYTRLAPGSPSFVIGTGPPVTVTVRATIPLTPGFLVINRGDGGMPVRIELTNACPVPPGCS
jgi:hypothetical protein